MYIVFVSGEDDIARFDSRRYNNSTNLKANLKKHETYEIGSKVGTFDEKIL